MRSRTDHQSRLDWWRRQIQRQPKTNLTITDFCRQPGVSVPTFYYWKRRVKAIERKVEGRDDPEARAIRGYCAAVRSALTDDGRPPLSVVKAS
jgi:hypothetical protein